jgi:DNA-binding NtrC family response regulator
MKPDMQVKLLRVIEQRQVRRLGSTEDIPVDVRIISASNRDLQAAIRQGTFRDDLYYRLAVITLNVPPLRERKADIAPIVAAYVDHYNREIGRCVEGLTPEAQAALEAYSWPGHVRELRNFVERAVILCDEPQIGIQHLPPEIARHSLDVTELERDQGQGMPYGRSLLEIERRLIGDAIARANGDMRAAAEMLGISDQELKNRLSTA